MSIRLQIFNLRAEGGLDTGKLTKHRGADIARSMKPPPGQKIGAPSTPFRAFRKRRQLGGTRTRRGGLKEIRYGIPLPWTEERGVLKVPVDEVLRTLRVSPKQ